MPAPRGPVIIEDERSERPDPAAAPPILDAPEPPEGRAMQSAIRLAARRPGSRAAGVFWAAAGALLSIVISLAAWDYVTGLIARIPLLGLAAAALAVVAAVALLVVLAREAAAMARLGRLDAIHRAASAALEAGDRAGMDAALGRLLALHAGRPELDRARTRVAERRAEQPDAAALAALAETELLMPLDEAARREVEAAARQVAAITAFVPLALADVAAALFANVRMIRRIAEIYGGRGGVLGGWRLTRAVLTHLVATGAVAVGDDLIGSVAGGGVLARVSRRFGEGIINGALTARVGVAALEVCRPLPFRAAPAPRVGTLVRRALTGLFDRA
jgi:putative membrane protein